MVNKYPDLMQYFEYYKANATIKWTFIPYKTTIENLLRIAKLEPGAIQLIWKHLRVELTPISTRYQTL